MKNENLEKKVGVEESIHPSDKKRRRRVQWREFIGRMRGINE